jgi:ribosomal-protein-alanine N-acetyltransferase
MIGYPYFTTLRTTLPGPLISSSAIGFVKDEMTLLQFEPVEARHADGLTELFERNSTPEITSSFDPFPLTSQEARRIALEPRQDGYYVAVRGDRLVGLSLLRGFDEGYAIPSFGIFVDREAHGQGIGRALTVWTIEAARRRGCSSLRLSVYGANSVACGLYASLGFVEQERRTIDRVAGPEEKIVMCLSLEG